jgi:dUTP pyrophosphatase
MSPVPGPLADPSARPSGRPASDQVEVLLRRLDPQLPAPGYAHPGDAGADLMTSVDVTLAPGQRQTVPTGVAIALPDGYAAFVHPRSGLAARSGVTVVNAPGTVDAGYRGEIQVTLLNTDLSTPVNLRRGDRIAQLIVQRVSRARFVEVERLPGSARGAGGFGSTGGIGSGVSASEQDASSVPGYDSSSVPGNDISARGNRARGQGEI